MRSGGVVCSKSRSYLIDAREALHIKRYCSALNRPPQPSLREGIPALLRRGTGSVPSPLDTGPSSRRPATELLFRCAHNFGRLEPEFLLQFFERRRCAEGMHSDHSAG
jgi:hypothetical protein